ncbi:MAG: sigma-70 family RNA polymerase sigma factor [Alicyclobacillus sp.]|nr:sigma-70 family RNA polymerase sigma factor [Alicyclobacillus sp.]
MKGEIWVKTTRRANERMLSPKEVTALVAAAQAGQADALEQLVWHFYPLLRRIAWRYRRVSHEDALQEAYLALMAGVQLYDPAQGVPFAGFIQAKVWGDVRTAMRREWTYDSRKAVVEVRDTDAPDAEVWDAAWEAAGGGGHAGASHSPAPGSARAGTSAGADYDAVELRVALERAPLSPRERQALYAVLRGEPSSRLAQRCGVSLDTARTWRKRALAKARVALGSAEDWMG